MKTLLLGDVCPTDESARFFKEKDLSTLFSDTLSLFENKDFIFTNLECAITDHDKKIEKFGPPSQSAL